MAQRRAKLNKVLSKKKVKLEHKKKNENKNKNFKRKMISMRLATYTP